MFSYFDYCDIFKCSNHFTLPKFYCSFNWCACEGGKVPKYHIHNAWKNTYLMSTLMRTHHGKNTRGSNVLFSPYWVMDAQSCYFWRGMKTYFSTLLTVISSQSKTCKWNVWTQWSKRLHWGVPRFNKDNVFGLFLFFKRYYNLLLVYFQSSIHFYQYQRGYIHNKLVA